MLESEAEIGGVGWALYLVTLLSQWPHPAFPKCEPWPGSTVLALDHTNGPAHPMQHLEGKLLVPRTPEPRDKGHSKPQGLASCALERVFSEIHAF